MLAKNLDGLRIKGETPVLVGFGVLLPLLRASLADGLLQVENTMVKVQVRPADGAEFAAPLPGNHGEPDECAPVRVLEGFVDDACSLLRCRRARVALRGGWRFGVSDGVCGDPLPSDRSTERAVQDEVDLPDG
jgi:hypothetical protein